MHQNVVDNILKIQKRRKLSQKEMCARAGITYEGWRKIRNGGDIKLSTLNGFADALRVHTRTLLRRTD